MHVHRYFRNKLTMYQNIYVGVSTYVYMCMYTCTYIHVDLFLYRYICGGICLATRTTFACRLLKSRSAWNRPRVLCDGWWRQHPLVGRTRCRRARSSPHERRIGRACRSSILSMPAPQAQQRPRLDAEISQSAAVRQARPTEAEQLVLRWDAVPFLYFDL